MTSNNEQKWEEQVMRGVQAFQKLVGEEFLTKTGFQIPQEWLDSLPEDEPEDEDSDIFPFLEAERILRIAEQSVLDGDIDQAAGLLSVADRYIRIAETETL